MRRSVFTLLGVIEIALAVGLVIFGWRLPGEAEVQQSLDRFSHVSQGAERQVDALQSQVRDLRRPELTRIAESLGPQTQAVTTLLHKQQLDFEAIQAMSQSLHQVADGLDGWAETLDVERMQQLGVALGETADYLDQEVVPAARKAAEGINEATAELERDARLLGQLLATAPPDLQAARDIHNSLARFEQALGRVAPALQLDRLDEIREGFAGIRMALDTTAGQVENLAGYTYPVVRIDGFTPKVSQKPFWPAGEDIAVGVRQGIKGLDAADEELAQLNEEMPAIRDSLDESRQAMAATRQAMAQALEQQEEIEGLLHDLPLRSAALVEGLPKLGQSLAEVLQRTERMERVAVSLRLAREGLDASLMHWPALEQSLQQSAGVLRSTGGQFDRLLAQREQYVRGLVASTALADQFAQALPLFSDQLDVRLGEQELALEQLKGGLSEVNGAMPEVARGASELMTGVQWLVWLMAGMVGLHGLYVVIEARGKTSGSGMSPSA